MLDKSINSALLALRKQIIRNGCDGLAHVEALLALRGVALQHVPRPKRPDAAGRNETALLIVAALKDGPKTRAQVCAALESARPNLDKTTCYRRVDRAMAKLQAKGVTFAVRRGVWGLAQ